MLAPGHRLSDQRPYWRYAGMDQLDIYRLCDPGPARRLALSRLQQTSPHSAIGPL